MSVFNQLMMKNKDIPSQYQVVDYIKSSGSQYINTQYNLKAHDKVKIELKVLSGNSTWASIFGARLSNYRDKCYSLFCNFGGNHQWAFCRTGQETVLTNCDNNIKYTIITKDNECTLQKEGETATTYTVGGTVEDCVSPCGIFTLNTSSSVNSFALDVPSKIKLYLFEIYDNNDILIKNYIPVFNKTINKYGLYDRINKMFLDNQGTGNFTGGND